MADICVTRTVLEKYLDLLALLDILKNECELSISAQQRIMEEVDP